MKFTVVTIGDFPQVVIAYVSSKIALTLIRPIPSVTTEYILYIDYSYTFFQAQVLEFCAGIQATQIATPFCSHFKRCFLPDFS